ncbi:MAG: GNAT family N-acetyltransferase [Elusimicrobiota bacterium]|nr:GNAT family N-acetyltransferase [Elusimicrobiota bacterium]
MNLSIRQTDEKEADGVNDLYRRCGYSGNVAQNDIVLLAEIDHAPVGAVRICEENGIRVLRGMYLLPAHQRAGIGSALLHRCIPAIKDRPCYCLPYAHLAGFYKQIGFSRINGIELPEFLKARLESYREKGLDVVAMKRPPNHDALERTAAR